MPTALELDAPRCLYPLTATTPAAAPELLEDVRTEVVIVGGGYTGLSTALHLAERGRAVVLLESREPGFGAAGRNGGQINAGLKYEPEVAERALGPVFGPRLVALALQAPQFLFALVRRLGIECELDQGGTLRAGYARSHLDALRASAAQWRRRGVPIELWGPDEVAAATGTRRYLGATFNPLGGSLNPLSLARGLARAARGAGARLHASSRVVALERDGAGWRARTAHATVRAERVLIATDGYTDRLWPRLAQSAVPIYSAIVATSPLPADLAAAILPRRPVVYETGHITAYYRRDAAGRLLMGGRGLQRKATDRQDYRHLMSYAQKLWPALAQIEWTHWWNGQFAVTADFYPRFHHPSSGLYILQGYSGRGLALSTAMGAELAAVLAGAAAQSFPLPVTPIRKMRLHRFWRLGVYARVAHGRLLDRLGR